MDENERIRALTAENARLRRENKRLRAQNKKIEFSKVILVAVGIMTTAISLFSCAMIWRTGDTSVLTLLIPAVFTETASATGFYYTKAKAENKIKLMQLSGVEPDAQTFETI